MSARKRGATGLSGVLLVDKPQGLTSHDVVARMRRATGEGRIGHAGTLDPMATGLLVILIGPATRLEPHLSSARKSYLAEITFGATTDTDDTEGQVVVTAAVPADLTTIERAGELLESLIGPSMQMPPSYSAIKVGGQTAHRAARAGSPLGLQPRAITTYEARLVEVLDEPVRWRVAFTVSKGTYVRALARDLGVAAGTVAHLSGLRRTASGTLSVDDALSLEEAIAVGERGELLRSFSDPVHALGLPSVLVAPSAIADGKSLRADAVDGIADGERVAVCSEDASALLAVYRASGDRLVPDAVFPNGISRGVR